MNPNPDGYGYRKSDGAYRFEGFSFDLYGGTALCRIVPEYLTWPEIGNQPTNIVYVTIGLSGEELDGNCNIRELQYRAGLDIPFFCLNQLLEDLDALRDGQTNQLQFPSGVKQLRDVTEVSITSAPEWNCRYMLQYRSSFPVEWQRPAVPLAWEVDRPPSPEEAGHDPFALKLLVRFPIGDDSLAQTRDRLRHFIQWVGDKAPGC